MKDSHDNHLYQVKDWNAYFEGAKSRTYNNKTTCQMPTKHGLGYKTLVRRKNGAALFGAWCALVQVLSRHPKDRDGWVTDNGKPDGKPYTPNNLATLTDLPEEVFLEMLQVCSSYEVSWLKDTTGNQTGTTRTPQGTIVPLHSDLDSNLDSNSNSNPQDKLVTVGDNSTVKGKENKIFNRFWTAYPRKVGKKAAFKSFLSAKDKPDIETIIKAIEAQKQTDQWRKDGGQFIPMPTTWLNQGRWSDETVKPVSITRPTEIRKSRDMVLMDAVDALDAADNQGGDVGRCLKALGDKYRDYGKNRDGLTVAGEAYEVFKYRKKGEE